MTEQEKQAIKDRFQYACKGLDYEQAVVLGGILGKVMTALDERDREVERLKERVRFHCEYGIYSNAMKEIERLRKTLDDLRKDMQRYRDNMFKKYLGFEAFDPRGIDFARQIIKVMDSFIEPARQALAGEEKKSE
jgi:hypothetical protein